jgi:Ribophorin I
LQYLFRQTDTDSFKLEIPVNHLLPTLPTDEYSIDISLPEGAVIERYESGLATTWSSSESLTYSYLNYFGRPTLRLRMSNHLGVVDPQAKIRVFYRFQQHFLFAQFGYPAVGLLLAFSAYLAISRLWLDFKQPHEDKDD